VTRRCQTLTSHMTLCPDHVPLCWLAAHHQPVYDAPTLQCQTTRNTRSHTLVVHVHTRTDNSGLILRYNRQVPRLASVLSEGRCLCGLWSSLGRLQGRSRWDIGYGLIIVIVIIITIWLVSSCTVTDGVTIFFLKKVMTFFNHRPQKSSPFLESSLSLPHSHTFTLPPSQPSK